MIRTRITLTVALAVGGLTGVRAQENGHSPAAVARAKAEIRRQLDESLAEFAKLQEQITAEQLPLAKQLNEFEARLIDIRREDQKKTRAVDRRVLDVTNLRARIKARKDETTYLSTLLGDYIREFESRLHIAEVQRYEGKLQAAKLAPEDSGLSEKEVFEAQVDVVSSSLERLHEALGGVLFKGRAVDTSGLVNEGVFALVGPAAIFRSAGDGEVGTAEQRLGSLEPAVVRFSDPRDAAAATNVLEGGAGSLPLDPTLGNAHKIDATEDSFLEHVGKGGPVMVPIFLLAAAALLVALYKWISLTLVPRPSRKQVDSLVDAVERRDEEAAKAKAHAIRGPIGKMLSVGVGYLREPRELIEEVMYEKVLTTRLHLQRLLPFIAICAASAPLLGLLGTVTGIINTFKLITVFGSGDVKMLSGGISEALITTKFGLIVAIPSLLLHAYLSRKARAVIGQMETIAVTFVNQISKTPFRRAARAGNGAVDVAAAPAAVDRDLVREQVSEILGEMLEPLRGDKLAEVPVRAQKSSQAG